MTFDVSTTPLDLSDRLLSAIRRVMAVDDVTSGDERQGFTLRVRGRLVVDPEEAFDRLDPIFAGEGVTLITRKDGERDAIFAMPGVIVPEASNPWVNALLFLLTLISVLIAGGRSRRTNAARDSKSDSRKYPWRTELRIEPAGHSGCARIRTLSCCALSSDGRHIALFSSVSGELVWNTRGIHPLERAT